MMREGRVAAVAMALAVAGPVAAQQVVTDDFADPTTGWTVRSDDGPVQIGYVGGQYQISATQPVGIVIGSSGYSFYDGTVSVEAQDLPDSAPHYSGLFVRAQDSANFYAFVLASDGSIGMFHYVNGTYVADGPSDLHLADGVYLTDAPNVLSVEASGLSLTFSVNGQEVATLRTVRWDQRRCRRDDRHQCQRTGGNGVRQLADRTRHQRLAALADKARGGDERGRPVAIGGKRGLGRGDAGCQRGARLMLA